MDYSKPEIIEKNGKLYGKIKKFILNMMKSAKNFTS